MLEQRKGRIVFIGSPAAWLAWSGATVYNASRWALRGLYEALRADLRGTGVGVSMIVPGQVKSAYFEHNPGVTERFPSLGRFIPVITPEEVARAVQTALKRESRIIVLPWLMRAFLMINQVLPRLVEWLIISSSFKRK
jgi:short-subunit dehydrogenase